MGARILPYCFLGDAASSAEKKELKRQGITHIVNCCSEEVENSFEDDFEYLDLPLEDEFGINISKYFDEVYDFVKAVKDSNKKVLIHCTDGKSIAPSFIIAYIMKAFFSQGKQTTLAATFKFVGNKEPGMNPEDKLLEQLINLEKDLYDGQCTMRTNALQPKRSNKRRGKGRGGKGRRGK